MGGGCKSSLTLQKRGVEKVLLLVMLKGGGGVT